VVVSAAPDATRDECLARCLVFAGVAASAADDIAKAAINATTTILIALRIIRSSSRREVDSNSLRLR
jgi:hypothetical protein